MDVSDELAKKTEKKRESPTRKISTSLSTQHIVAAGFVALVLFYFVYITKKIQPKEGIIIAVIFVVIMYLLMSKGEKGIIPIKEAKALLLKELRYMQRETKEIPPGRIKPNMQFRLQCVDGIPDRYYIRFEIEQWNGACKVYVAEMDPFTGYLVGTSQRDEGFEGNEHEAHIKFYKEQKKGEYFDRSER